MIKRFFSQFFILLLLEVFSIQILNAQKKAPPFLNPQSKLWADSIMINMSRREKIAQLFMVATWSGTDLYNKPLIDSLITNYKIGGLIFFQGGPVRQVNLINYYQSISKTPLLTGFDGEWGLSMRLDSVIRFPRQMTLGAMPDPKLIYDMGAEIARQCRLVGINVNFAPDIDINNNPNNPVINSRSFGENKFEVTRRGMEYMKGMQDNYVLACGKHFPGHGNTDTDSHFSLPLLNQTAEELDSVELLPFRRLIDEGMGSVMVAHLNVPALDTTFNLPSTLSRPIITDLLKNKMSFDGLIFTDALDMKGVTAFYKTGELEVLTLKAGCEVLLNSENIPVALDSIDHAIESGFLDSNIVYQSVEKILQLKYWCGLNKPLLLDTTDLYNRLNKNENAQWLNYQLYRNSITLLKNENKALPLKSFNEKSIASLIINDSLNNTFQQVMSKYAFIDLFKMNKEIPSKEFDSLISIISKYKTVIVSIHNTSTKVATNFGISPQMNKVIERLKNKTKLIVVIFGNSYTLSKLTEAKKADALLLSYEDTYLPALITSQVLFGAIQPRGTIPVAPDSSYVTGEGLGKMDSMNVLKYSQPLEYNVDGRTLGTIDSIAENAIEHHAMPGCQILVAYKGSVIYNKSFGTYSYTDSAKVQNDNLYDIASVTKIASTALATMMIYDKGDIDVNKKLSKYLPDLKKSNKKDLLLRDILTHQAGLLPWIPFYKETLADSNDYKPGIYNSFQSSEFPYQVADSLFINKDYPGKIWKQIIQTELKDSGKYVYSDFGPIIMQHIIERLEDESLDSVVFRKFYKPLGVQNIMYHPLRKFKKNEIIPTEYDSAFRKQLIQGYVHDPAAAMLGGVCGNAGVFSNAQALAVVMQMLLQNGNYGGHQYIKKETVEFFTKQFYKYTTNRRGLLFDKPEPDKSKNGPTSKSSSPNTFGHQGFTGTCAWADPDKELVYIFLSNRINPSAENNKLSQMNVRTEIMEAIYKALPQK